MVDQIWVAFCMQFNYNDNDNGIQVQYFLYLYGIFGTINDKGSSFVQTISFPNYYCYNDTNQPNAALEFSL